MVRRHFHGQHADGFLEPALRLFAVLSEKRRAARDQHGDDLPRLGQFHGLQWTGVGLCILFPQIVTWLPSLIYSH